MEAICHEHGLALPHDDGVVAGEESPGDECPIKNDNLCTQTDEVLC